MSGIPTMSSSSVSESTFFPRLHGAVFLFWIRQTSFPAAEHFADLLQFESNTLALLVRNEFSFPGRGDQKFKKIGCQNTFHDFLRLLFFFGKISDICRLQKIKEFIFNSRANSIAGAFCDMRRNIHPKQISLFDSIEDGGITERERVNGAPNHIFHNIISLENLLAAWREFLRGKRKRKDVAEFSLNLTSNIIALYCELADKTYRHGAYKSFKINDPKPRDIHKATVRDRLLHHAIYRILYPCFDPKFIFDSYSCRYDKGVHRAINRFRAYARTVSKNHTRIAWVLKCDIRKFFASIDHETLINVLKRRIKDKDVIWLLREVVGSFHAESKPGVGLPLGNLTSQLLVNVYMNEFDHFLKRELKIAYCIRYADDFVILQEDKKYLENILSKISAFLETKLKLSLHPDKVFIKTLTSGVDFLGWVHFPHHRVPRTSTKRRMFKKLATTDSPQSKVSYLGLLSHGNTYRLQQRIMRLK